MGRGTEIISNNDLATHAERAQHHPTLGEKPVRHSLAAQRVQCLVVVLAAARVTAVAWIGSLAWELPHTRGTGQKKKGGGTQRLVPQFLDAIPALCGCSAVSSVPPNSPSFPPFAPNNYQVNSISQIIFIEHLL